MFLLVFLVELVLGKVVAVSVIDGLQTVPPPVTHGVNYDAFEHVAGLLCRFLRNFV
jgi:hypothetical protein